MVHCLGPANSIHEFASKAKPKLVAKSKEPKEQKEAAAAKPVGLCREAKEQNDAAAVKRETLLEDERLCEEDEWQKKAQVESSNRREVLIWSREHCDFAILVA
jgi:hypothetical protein